MSISIIYSKAAKLIIKIRLELSEFDVPPLIRFIGTKDLEPSFHFVRTERCCHVFRRILRGNI